MRLDDDSADFVPILCQSADKTRRIASDLRQTNEDLHERETTSPSSFVNGPITGNSDLHSLDGRLLARSSGAGQQHRHGDQELPVMTSRYRRQGILFALASAVSRLGGLVLVPVYTRRLTSAELGIVAITAAVAALAQIASTLSLDNAAARWLGTAESAQDARVTIATWLGIQWRSSAVCAAVIAIGAMVTTSGALRLSLVLIASANVVATPFVVLTTSFRQSARARPVILTSLVGALVSMVFSCVVVAAGFGAPGVALGTLAGSTASGLLSVRWLRPELRGARPDRERRRALLRFGLPLLPGAAAQWVSSLVDRFFVGAWWGTGEVGRYQVAQFCSAGPAIFATAFQAAWGPWAMSTMRHDDAPKRIARATHIATLIGSIVCLLYSLAAPELLPIVAPGYSRVLSDVVLLAHAHLFLTCTFAVAAGPMILGRTREVGTAMICGAVLNLALNVILIPSLALRGAAIATVVSFLSVPITIVALSRKLIVVPVPWVRVSVVLVANFALSLLGASTLRNQLFPRVMLAAVSIGIAWLIGLSAQQRQQTLSVVSHRIRK